MQLFILSRSVAAFIPYLSSLLKNYSQTFCYRLTLYAFNSLLQRLLLLSSVVHNIFILTHHPVLYLALYVHTFNFVT